MSNSNTFRLFISNNMPTSFIEGMGSVLDFSSSDGYYEFDKTPSEADYNSLRADWLQVGNDLRNAINEQEATKESR
jgi:hypothetical protein